MLSVPQPQFHWVPKDIHSQSLSNTRDDEQKQIRRFVQHKRLAARKIGALQIKFAKEQSAPITLTKPKAPKITIRSPIESSGSDVSLWSSSDFTSSTEWRSNKENIVAPRRKQPRDGALQLARRSNVKRRRASPDVGHSDNFTAIQSEWRLTPLNLLDGSSIDPFNTTTLAVAHEGANLLNYWSSVILAGGNAYKLQILPTRVKGVTPISAVREEYLSNALRYEHCLYALFSFVSSRLVQVSKIRLKGMQDPAYYMSKSVSLIRQRLTELQRSGSVIDTPTIGAIAQIALADWTSGDLASARVHLGTLSKVIDQVDIESPTERYLIETIRTADFQVAVEGHTQPMLCAVPSFEPISRQRIKELEREVRIAIEEDTGHDNDIASRLGQDLLQPDDILSDLPTTLDLRLGWSLEQILESDVIVPSLHPTIRNMLDVLTIMKAVWRLGVAELKDARIMCRWGRTQGHALFTYGYEHEYDEPTSQMLLTDCVRLSLLVVHALATNRMGRRVARGIGHELFEACQRYDFAFDSSDDLAAKAYLWALITAAMVTEDSTEHRFWLLQRAASSSIQLNLTTYEDLHEAMSGFLYSWTYSMQTMCKILSAVNLQQSVNWHEVDMATI